MGKETFKGKTRHIEREHYSILILLNTGFGH